MAPPTLAMTPAGDPRRRRASPTSSWSVDVEACVPYRARRGTAMLATMAETPWWRRVSDDVKDWLAPKPEQNSGAPHESLIGARRRLRGLRQEVPPRVVRSPVVDDGVDCELVHGRVQ